MELFQAYPIAYIVTIVLPLVSGLVLSIGGYESLKARAESDAQLSRIEENTKTIAAKMPDVTATLAVLNRYEQSLAAAGARDDALTAVLVQYEAMKKAMEAWKNRVGAKSLQERMELAEEVLDVLKKNLVPISVNEELPGYPLILNLGKNTFRVLFSVPMRIPPALAFQGIPPGVTHTITEHSRFGFTVRFEPTEINITHFGFTADAEL